MKLNKKGVTLVELIISFAILMVIVVGMLTIVINVRSSIGTKTFDKEMYEYKTDLTRLINKDLSERGFVSLTNCTFATGEVSECKIINFKDGTSSELRINLKTYIISYNEINYPIPNIDFIEFTDYRVMANTNVNKNVFIKVETNYLKINIPYYEIDKDYNYGIKVIFPINL